MRQITIVAAIAVAASLAAIPAKAERNWGPLRQNGQCWQASPNHSGSNAGTWGYWGACPQAASTAAVATRRHHRASR